MPHCPGAPGSSACHWKDADIVPKGRPDFADEASAQLSEGPSDSGVLGGFLLGSHRPLCRERTLQPWVGLPVRLYSTQPHHTSAEEERAMKTAHSPATQGTGGPQGIEVTRWVYRGEMASLPGGTEEAPWVVRNWGHMMDKQCFWSKRSRRKSKVQAELFESLSGSLRTSALRLYANWWLICYQIYSGFF